MKNNKNSAIAIKLEIVLQSISEIDKTNTDQAIASIRQAHTDIEQIAQEHDVPMLRAVIHWMTLNTEIYDDNHQQVSTLLENDHYSNWIEVLAVLLNKNDFTLLPTLHQSLTSPDWIIRPSALLLKGVAAWLTEIKAENELFNSQNRPTEINTDLVDNILIHQTSHQTLQDQEVIDSEYESGSIDVLINDQLMKAAEANEDTLIHQTIFKEIDNEIIEKEYKTDDISSEYSINKNLNEFEEIQSSEKINMPLMEADFLIDEDLLAKNETLIESLINASPNSIINEEIQEDKSLDKNVKDEFELNNLEYDLMDVYQTLTSINANSSDVFSAKESYIRELSRLTVLSDGSSLESIEPITSWCQTNIVLFDANPTDEIKTFIRDNLAWSWIKDLHGCLNNFNKNTCLKDLTNSLTHKEWLQPVDTTELETLLISLKNILNNKDLKTNDENTSVKKYISESDLFDQKSSEIFDMPQLIDDALIELNDTGDQLSKVETSGFQITWDDDTHPELLMVYLEETPPQISELQPLLNKISTNKANEEEKVIAARLAHTIKGGSAIVGITALSELSYRLETLLDHSIKHKLDDETLELLPSAGNCLELVFDAIQLQQEEPATYFQIFKTLDHYVSNLDTDDEILTISSTPVLPDFIINQNKDNEELVSPEVLTECKELGEIEELDKKNVEEEIPVEKKNIVEVIIEKSDFQLTWNDDTHPELLMVYLEETPTQINQLVPLLNKISDGTADADEKHTASRMAHTIKGGSAIVGITALSVIAYRLESLLDHSIKHQLPTEILSLLPKTASCLEELFDAVQMQEEEPAEYYSIFKQLDGFVQTMNDGIEENDEPLELSSPVLPDFIVNQNSDNPSEVEVENSIEEYVEIETNDSVETIESVIVETAQLAKLESEEDVNEIVSEIDDIVMQLVNISSNSKNIGENISQYSLVLERFELLAEISGYPELSLLSQWCQTNLSLFAKNDNEETTAFVNSAESWAWIEFVGATLSMPDDMSHLSSLSVELMRDDWAQAIEMEDLQTVLLALRHLEDTDTSIDTEYVAESIDGDDIVSWDKDVHPELLAVYFKETPDQIFEVAGLLHKISKGESTTEENKKAARIAHTIKGASGVVGLNSLLELTHSLEDILDYSVTNKISDETAELLAEASDCMESLFEAIQSKKAAPEELSSVLERLSAFSKSLDGNLPTVSSMLKAEIVEIEKQQKLSIETLSSTEILSTTNSSDVNDILPIDPNIASKIDINEAHIRVPISIIDKLLNLAGELVTTSNQVSDDLAKSLATNKTIKNQDARVSYILEELSNTISQQEKDQHTLLSSLDNSNFDDLEMDSYNELHSVASLLSESFLDSQEIDNTLNKQLSGLSDKLHSLDKLNKDFSDVILSSRMVSIDSIIPRLERIVRQTCRKTDKKAKLMVTGNHINIDTDILNGLVDSLLHMLRNSIDHGIESPAERSKSNKDETGLIELSFTRDGNNILMSLKDDGAGINPEIIYQKALHKDLITSDQELSKRETLNLILTPGFSTQEKVTNISGRGVGMDVVNSSVEELNGSLAIESEVGKGTSFNLRIPLTLITNTTLLVKAAKNTIAIPIDTIEQIIYQEANNVIQHDDSYFVSYEDQELEINSLSHLLEMSNQAIDYTQSFNVLIIKSGRKFYAIHVDSIVSSREVVVKSLNPWISPTKGIVGACHLNDGGVAPVINLSTVVKRAQNDNHTVNVSKKTLANDLSASRATPQILVVDDSLSNRKALSLIIDKTEYDVITAVDGMDALQIMNEKTIDLVFTDLEMPRMNGIELTQAIRAWTGKNKTPIVMITSRTTNKHRELATKAGVDDYLTKPVATETLLDSINTWLVEKVTVEA